MLNKLAKQEQGFDYVFLDPPYKKQQILELMEQLKKIRAVKYRCFDHLWNRSSRDLPEELADLNLLKKLITGSQN